MPLTTPDFIRPRLGMPVAVFGGAVSGTGAVSLLSRIGATSVVYDRSGTEFTAEAAGRHRLAVFSPGFSADHRWLEVARKAGCICLAEIDFASLFWQGRMVAVTGTNGKTTLTEFLSGALCSTGAKALAAGNIGLPLSRVVADEDGGGPDITAVCEVSSFQAERLGHFEADSLIWTNFAEDHLERHGSMKAYFGAKWELVPRTKPGHFFAGSSVQRYAEQLGCPLPAGAPIPTEGQPGDPRLAGTVFESYPQRENFILASAWWRSEGLDEAVLVQAARSFQLGRHRLSRVATVDGVTYWNDSKATNFHAVEAALASFRGPVVLIAGGRSKGGDVEGFVRRIAPRVAHAALIGETGTVLGAAFETAGVSTTAHASMDDAVRGAAAAAAANGSADVILSPAFSSFDMFRSYEDRGERFELAVAELQAARV